MSDDAKQELEVFFYIVATLVILTGIICGLYAVFHRDANTIESAEAAVESSDQKMIATDDGTILNLDPETGTYSIVAGVTVSTEDDIALKLDPETQTYSVIMN